MYKGQKFLIFLRIFHDKPGTRLFSLAMRSQMSFPWERQILNANGNTSNHPIAPRLMLCTTNPSSSYQRNPAWPRSKGQSRTTSYIPMIIQWQTKRNSKFSINNGQIRMHVGESSNCKTRYRENNNLNLATESGKVVKLFWKNTNCGRVIHRFNNTV